LLLGGERVSTLQEIRTVIENYLEQLQELIISSENQSLTKRGLTKEGLSIVRTVILLHDLHKIFSAKGFKHYDLPSPLKEADVLASRMGRDNNYKRENLEEQDTRLRYNIQTRSPVTEKEPHEEDLKENLQIEDIKKLHATIINSKALNQLNEARKYPYSSLKHHVLLATALTEIFLEQEQTSLKGIVLCITTKRPKNNYTIIGRCYEKKIEGKRLLSVFSH
jgi:hypothetical protein